MIDILIRSEIMFILKLIANYILPKRATIMFEIF